jgi:hypothetical protein
VPLIGATTGGGNTPTTTGGVALNPAAGYGVANISSPTYEKEIAGYLYGGYAGTIAKSQLGTALGSEALGLSPYGMALTAQGLQAGAGFTFAGAMLGYRGLGLESQTLARQASTAAGQQGLEQAMYGITASRYPQEAAQASQKYLMTQLGLQGQGAGTGTLNTAGSYNAQRTAAQQYSWQLATIYRSQQLASLGQQSEQLGYATKAGGFGNAQQQLALSAQQQGLSVQEMEERLQFGLSQLGIKATPASLLQSLATAQGAEATTLKAYLSQAGLLGGVSANVLPPGF